MNEWRPLVRASVVVVSLLAGFVPAAATEAMGATGGGGRTVVSLKATVSDAQVAHEGPGEDGDGESAIQLVSLNRPSLTLSETSKPQTRSIRVAGAGDAHARFGFVDRITGGLSRSAECESPLRIAARNAPATFVVARDARGRRTLQVQLALPYVRAPFVEANDLYPPSGPCDQSTGVGVRTLRIVRTVPFRLLAQARVPVRFSGKRTTTSGDITYTTSWDVTLTLVRQ